MGLSSSQARLLNMTSRMHQIEYKAAKLEAQKLQMANESTRVYGEYLDALEATKVQVKTIKSDGSTSYKDITNYANDFIASGFAIQYKGMTFDNTSTANLWEKDGKYYTAENKPADATQANNVTLNWDTLCNLAFGATTAPTNVSEVITNLINTGDCIIMEQDKKSTATPKPFDIETSVAINTSLQEVNDESKLRKAEAKYEADMRKIDAKDRKYDSDLAALDTERNAIKSEMETLKTVAKDNVERTFKLFS